MTGARTLDPFDGKLAMLASKTPTNLEARNISGYWSELPVFHNGIQMLSGKS
jgi:hypothetical protein